MTLQSVWSPQRGRPNKEIQIKDFSLIYKTMFWQEPMQTFQELTIMLLPFAGEILLQI